MLAGKRNNSGEIQNVTVLGLLSIALMRRQLQKRPKGSDSNSSAHIWEKMEDRAASAKALGQKSSRNRWYSPRKPVWFG